MKINKLLLFVGALFVLVFIFLVWTLATMPPRPRQVYDQAKSLSAEARKYARVYKQTTYTVGSFSNDEVTLELALIPAKDEWTIIPLTPCTPEQANLKDGDSVAFEYSEQSLDPNQPNSMNLLCYMAIKH